MDPWPILAGIQPGSLREASTGISAPLLRRRPSTTPSGSPTPQHPQTLPFRSRSDPAPIPLRSCSDPAPILQHKGRDPRSGYLRRCREAILRRRLSASSAPRIPILTSRRDCEGKSATTATTCNATASGSTATAGNCLPRRHRRLLRLRHSSRSNLQISNPFHQLHLRYFNNNNNNKNDHPVS